MKKQFNISADDTEKILKDLGVTYERRNDGTFYVPDNISLSNKNLTTLPDLSRVEVGQSFWCDNNQLTSLEGAPYKVGGDFWCDDNRLVTLKGGPSYVGDLFYCDRNKLTSLEHAPATFKEMHSDFGDFGLWEAVPAHLKVSDETRMQQQKDFEHGVKSSVNVAVPQTDGQQIHTTKRRKISVTKS